MRVKKRKGRRMREIFLIKIITNSIFIIIIIIE